MLLPRTRTPPQAPELLHSDTCGHWVLQGPDARSWGTEGGQGDLGRGPHFLQPVLPCWGVPGTPPQQRLPTAMGGWSSPCPGGCFSPGTVPTAPPQGSRAPRAQLCPQTQHPVPVPSRTFHGPRARQGQQRQQRQQDAPSSDHGRSWHRAARAGPGEGSALLLAGNWVLGACARRTGPPRAQPMGGRPDGDSGVPRQSSSAEHPAEQTDGWTHRRVPQGCTDELGLRSPLERARRRAGVGAAGAGEPQCLGDRQPPPRAQGSIAGQVSARALRGAALPGDG